MFIISKDRESIINLDHVACLYLSGEGYDIRVELDNGKPWKTGRYSSPQAAEAAMRILLRNIGSSGETCIMPSDEEAEAEIRRIPEEKARYRNGKKMKGHGGS